MRSPWGASPRRRRSAAQSPRNERSWPGSPHCDDGALPRKSRGSLYSSPRTMLRTSPGRRSSSTADTRYARHALGRRKGHALHQEGPARSAGVTDEDEGRASGHELLAHDPMTSSAHAHESDLFRLSADAEEQAVLGTPPTLDDNPVCRVDADLADRRHVGLNGWAP